MQRIRLCKMIFPWCWKLNLRPDLLKYYLTVMHTKHCDYIYARSYKPGNCAQQPTWHSLPLQIGTETGLLDFLEVFAVYSDRHGSVPHLLQAEFKVGGRLNLIQGPYDDDVGEEEAGGCSKGSRVSDIATRFESLGRVQEPLVTISASADTDICQTEIHHEDLTIASAVKSSIPEPSADIIFSNCSGDFLLLQHNRLVSNWLGRCSMPVSVFKKFKEYMILKILYRSSAILIIGRFEQTILRNWLTCGPNTSSLQVVVCKSRSYSF